MWFIPIVLLVSRGAFVHVAFTSPAPVSTMGKFKYTPFLATTTSAAKIFAKESGSLE